MQSRLSQRLLGLYLYCVKDYWFCVRLVVLLRPRVQVTQRTTLLRFSIVRLLSFKAELIVLLEGNDVLLCERYLRK